MKMALASYYGEFVGANDIDEIEIKLDFEDEPQKFEIRHLRVAKKFKPIKNFNRMLIFGNDRAADESSLDASLGITLLCDDEVYIGCVSSTYLDGHVNSERTGFTLSSDELTDIKKQLMPTVRKFLQVEVDKVYEKKRKTTQSLIQNYPQFFVHQR